MNCACGRPATSGSSRGECGFHFRQRLLSVSLDGSVTFTRTPQNRYDSESLENIFGHDAEDRMMEKTQGLGGGVVKDGVHYHRDRRSKELVKTSAKQMDEVYLNAKSEDWAD